MATTGEQELEYESDPEEAKRSLAMRRREASDDEEGDGEGGDKRVDRRSGIRSDDSDGQGGVAEYDDDEEEEYNEAEEEDDEEAYDEEEVEVGDEIEEQVYEDRGGDSDRHGAEGSVVPAKESDSIARSTLDESVDAHPGNADDEEEKKENKPFAVPTAGAFYMHDDRFRDNVGGRHR